MKIIRVLSLTAVFMMGLSSLLRAETMEIKFANIAPEGSSWAKIMTAMDRELQQKTGGRLKFKIYWGGVMGDEADMIRKMRIGQLHGAGLTGNGVGQIAPSVRVLELPLLYPSAEKLDEVKKSLEPTFKGEFQKAGYRLVGWADVGPIYIFTNRPIKTLSDMQGVKMWLWEGDPLAKSAFNALGLNPIPLAITDVLTSLQTGMIDGFYGPPLGTMALQWHTQVKYAIDLKFNYAMGAFVLTNQFYNSIPADLKPIFDEVTKKYCQLLVDQTRVDNDKAYEVLKKGGISFLPVPEEEQKKLLEKVSTTWSGLVGQLYSQGILDQAKAVAAAPASGPKAALTGEKHDSVLAAH